ncbi:hypothetical protein FRB96_001578 [Tulasnella sp. 330]|nr:hypothetical protein FRB96_001578 [Tulasnella sp. 330]
MPLTYEGWKTLSNKLTKLVSDGKEGRLREERIQVVGPRRQVAITIYRQYKTAGLRDHSLAPSEKEALTTSTFHDIVELEGNEQVTEEDFHVATTPLHDLVSDWRKAKMTELLKFIASSGGPLVPDVSSDSDLAVLSLAKTFFGCKKPSPGSGGNILTLDDLGRHSCCRTTAHMDTRPFIGNPASFNQSFDRRDPNTTTTAGMDELDARFYSRDYPKGPNLARNWRNCAAQTTEHPLSNFNERTRPSPANATKIIEHEHADPKSPANRLKCGYCGAVGPTLPQLVQHLATKHGKRNLGPEDFRVDHLIPSRPVSLPGHPLSDASMNARSSKKSLRYRACGLQNLRFFALDDLESHAKAVHDNSNITIADYVDVNAPDPAQRLERVGQGRRAKGQRYILGESSGSGGSEKTTNDLGPELSKCFEIEEGEVNER